MSLRLHNIFNFFFSVDGDWTDMPGGSELIELFSCSTLLSLKFILLINVKMPTFVGILTFSSRLNELLTF